MKHQFLLSRKGSYIAEAAVVLPIIILTVITVILIIMYFYDESVNVSKMHVALRCEAGQITEKTKSYINEDDVTDSGSIWDGTMSVSRRGLFKAVSGKKNISIIAKGIIKYRDTDTISDSVHAVDGPTFVRIWSNKND